MVSFEPYYAGRRVAFLTQHGKERVVAPVISAALDCRVEHVTGYDTDQLGTFTREIPRAGTQLDAARRKARIGMDLAGTPFGLASEGSFGPDPMAGFFPWNVEILVFLDDERNLEVVGVAQGGATSAHLLTTDQAQAEDFARRVGFPEQYLVVRPQTQDDPRIRKGIRSWQDFTDAFASARRDSSDGNVFVETDNRAHANPTRMDNIRRAAENLAERLQSLCPACGSPGYWLVERISGLACGCCGSPTRETSAEVYGCMKCEQRDMRAYPDSRHADPARCDYCNP